MRDNCTFTTRIREEKRKQTRKWEKRNLIETGTKKRVVCLNQQQRWERDRDGDWAQLSLGIKEIDWWRRDQLLLLIGCDVGDENFHLSYYYQSFVCLFLVVGGGVDVAWQLRGRVASRLRFFFCFSSLFFVCRALNFCLFVFQPMQQTIQMITNVTCISTLWRTHH